MQLLESLLILLLVIACSGLLLKNRQYKQLIERLTTRKEAEITMKRAAVEMDRVLEALANRKGKPSTDDKNAENRSLSQINRVQYFCSYSLDSHSRIPDKIMCNLFNQYSLRQMLKSICLLISASILVACQQSDFETVKGPTMGTFYQVKYLPATKDTGTLKADVDQLLDDINQQMSTYINDSELSQLNQNQSTQCLPVSSPLLEVILEAKRVHTLSEGAFDPTLGPLIEIWGFGKKETNEAIPDANSVQQGIEQLSFKQTSINRGESCVSKGRAVTQINLSAIAKGYAVDKIAELLETAYQVEHYLVDIGGEVKLKGDSPRNTAWNIAIEAPNDQQRSVQRIINPGNRGVATSGDYRNYFEKDGKRYSHTINPQTGYPITHNLASVTVVHRSTMTADALATAFLVLGEDQTMKLAERENIAVFMIIKTPEGFSEVFNRSFKPFLKTLAK